MSDPQNTERDGARPEAGDYDAPLTACRLCGGSSLRPYHRDDKGRRIQRCAGCGAQFMNPQYSDAYLEAYYADYIHAEDEDDAAHRFLHDYNLDLIEARLPGTGRLLDIGCGRGHLLRAARERGWEVTGHDVDPATVAQVAREYDLPLLAGDFLALDLPAAHFDAITLHHVIEHLKDPTPFLARVRELLRPGGLLFLAQPNIAGLSSQMKFVQEKLGLRRRGIGSYYDADHHLFYFTPATLGRFVERHGFAIEYRQSAPKLRVDDPDWLRRLRRRTSDRLLLRSSFLMLCRKAG